MANPKVKQAKPQSRAATGAPVGEARIRKQNKAAQRTQVARTASQGRKNQARRDRSR